MYRCVSERVFWTTVVQHVNFNGFNSGWQTLIQPDISQEIKSWAIICSHTCCCCLKRFSQTFLTPDPLHNPKHYTIFKNSSEISSACSTTSVYKTGSATSISCFITTTISTHTCAESCFQQSHQSTTVFFKVCVGEKDNHSK